MTRERYENLASNAQHLDDNVHYFIKAADQRVESRSSCLSAEHIKFRAGRMPSLHNKTNMPLHLLGKKSWNVYNKDNIAKVRGDEAAAEIRAKEEQRRIDEADAESRLQTLRGIQNETHEVRQVVDTEGHEVQTHRRIKKRKLDGEDDTERDLRLALQAGRVDTPGRAPTSSRQENISLTDKHGHINLFPEDGARQIRGNAEVAAESAKRQQDLEDQYTMRFANAAGRSVGLSQPWYNGPVREKQESAVENPRRREREQKRMDANDPLAAMKKGVKQLREADKHREEWRAQRERDLNEVEELARKHKHRKKRRHSDEDSLDGFDLDEGYKDRSERRRPKSSSESHHRRHKEASRFRRDHESRC